MNKPINLQVKSNNSLLVMPLYFEKSSALDGRNYNVSIDFYLKDVPNSTNYIEIYLAKLYSRSCYGKSRKIGRIMTKEGEKILCAIKKLNESDFDSDYIGSLNFEVEKTKEPAQSKIIVFNINPFYSGELNLKMIIKLVDLWEE